MSRPRRNEGGCSGRRTNDSAARGNNVQRLSMPTSGFGIGDGSSENTLAQLLAGAMFGPMMGGMGPPGAVSMDQMLERLRAAYEPQAHPTARSTLDSLLTATITSDHILDDEACAICQEEYAVGEAGVVELGCTHMFHKSCVEGWLKDHNVCPTCRFELPEESEPEEPDNSGCECPTCRASRGEEPEEEDFDGHDDAEEEEDVDERAQADPTQELMSMLGAQGVQFAPGFQSNRGGRRRLNGRGTTGLPAGFELALGMGTIPGLGIGGAGFMSMPGVDADGFVEDDMSAAIAASLRESGSGGGPRSGDGGGAASRAGPRAAPAAVPAAAPAYDMSFAQAVYDSISTLSKAELLEQCVLEGVELDASVDRDSCIRALCTHQGVPPQALLRLRGVAKSTLVAPDFLATVRVPSEPAVDDAQAYTLQIRLPDGAHLTRRFDMRDTVGQIVAFVLSSIGPGRAREFGLKNGNGTPQVRLRYPGLLSAANGVSSPGYGPDMFDMELGETSLSKRSTLYVEPMGKP